MSRAKLAPINRAKVKARLKELGKTQIDLAAELGMNYHALNDILRKGKMSEGLADDLCRTLDLAPEYLADETPDGLFPDAPHNYALHEFQSVPMRSWGEVVSSMLYIGWCLRPEDLSTTQRREFLKMIRTTSEEYLRSIKKI